VAYGLSFVQVECREANRLLARYGAGDPVVQGFSREIVTVRVADTRSRNADGDRGISEKVDDHDLNSREKEVVE
jgi:hypothetical protein